MSLFIPIMAYSKLAKCVLIKNTHNQKKFINTNNIYPLDLYKYMYIYIFHLLPYYYT